MKINDIIFKSSRQNQPARVFKQLLVIFLFSICIISTAFAAKPVTVIVSLRPPYTPFLNEYGSLGADQLQVSIIVNDSRMINYPAKLQMLIERVGSGVVMRTGDYASIAPIMLTGNVTEFFNGFDLSEHFLYENLVFVGMDGSQYLRTGHIPNDRYRIGFRVVDSRRPEVVLSNTSYSQPGWFLLNNPPQINIPINQSVVRVNEVQNVKFNWFPRHLGSLNKSFSSLFQLEVFAIRVPGMNPNQLASSMSPNFTDVTSLTSYFLTSDKYVLEPGVEYAFRVKAMSGSGDELTLFQNQGYSDVHSFTYGTVCHAPENNIAEPLGRDKVLIKWDNAPSHTSFEVRFRRAGHSEDKWHQRESVTENVEIGNILSSGVSYEYQIKGICLNVASDYSPLSTFTLPEPVETDFDCGAEDSVIAVTNRVPKQSLRAGDKVHYGKFPIKLTEVSGSNGIFTGKGRMRVPFLAYASVNMQFNGIKVNELNEVYEGEVVSIYNPDSKFLINDVTDYFVAGDQVGNIVSGEAEAAITLDYVVGDASNLEVTVSGNSVTVRSSQGSSSTHSITTSTDSITISDSEGNLYVVDKGGGVSQVISREGQIPNRTTETDSVLLVQKELIKEVLEHIKIEINLWLENNGKGPLDYALISRLMTMPNCLPEDEEQLEVVLTKIKKFLENLEAFLELVEENDANKARIEELTNQLIGYQPPYAMGLSEAEWEELLEMICPYLLPEEEEQIQYTLPLTVYLDDDYYLLNPDKIAFTKGDTITIEGYMAEVTLFIKDSESQSVELLSSHFPDNTGQVWPPGFIVNIEKLEEGEIEEVKILIPEVDTLLLYIEKYKPAMEMSQSDILALLSDINEAQNEDKTTCDLLGRLTDYNEGGISGEVGKVKVNEEYEVQSLKLKLVNQKNTEMSLEDVDITIIEGADKDEEIAVFTFSATEDGEKLLELTIEKKDQDFLEWYLLGKKPVFKITMTNETDDDYATLSSFTINRGDFSGYFLERSEGTPAQERTAGSYKRIPEGDYKMCYTYKQCRSATTRINADNETWIKTNGETDKTGATITREYVLIHRGNYPWDSAGCLLIGNGYSDHTLIKDYYENATSILYTKDLVVKMVESSGTKLTALNNEYKKLIDLTNKFDDDCENSKCYELEIDINR